LEEYLLHPEAMLSWRSCLTEKKKKFGRILASPRDQAQLEELSRSKGEEAKKNTCFTQRPGLDTVNTEETVQSVDGLKSSLSSTDFLYTQMIQQGLMPHHNSIFCSDVRFTKKSFTNVSFEIHQ